jgi:hypothetical protein
VGQKLHGALHLVDLAGSERLSRSGATGATLKETQAINKSLSALGDVFTSITNKASHVPFRNSKLTYLMAPCLSGDGKTLMVVNIAPEVSPGATRATVSSRTRRCVRMGWARHTIAHHACAYPLPCSLSSRARPAQAENGMESLSSMRFASQVNACEIGRPKRSVRAEKAEAERESRPSMSRSESRPSLSRAESRPSLASNSSRPTMGSRPATARAAPAPAGGVRKVAPGGAGAGVRRPATSGGR